MSENIGLLDVVMMGFKWMIPPKIDATPEKQYWWRVRVGVFTCAAFGGLLIFAASTYGYIHGVDGFVRSTELSFAVQGVNNNISGLKADITKSVANLELERNTDTIDRLKSELLRTNETRCRLKPGMARGLYADQIAAMQERYAFLTGKVNGFPLPACSDL